MFPEGEGKPGYFKNNEEFMKSFIGWMNPKMEAQMQAIANKEREQKRKEYATYQGKPMTTSQRATIWNNLDKRYEAQHTNVLGELNPDAPERETWKAEQYEAITGHPWQAKAPKEAPPSGAIAEPGERPAPKKQARPTYQSFKDPKTGNIKRVYPNGRQEIISPEGSVISVRKSVPERTQKKGEQVPQEAKKKASNQGYAIYTDPKTGKKMKATMKADGTIETEPYESGKKKKKGV